MFNVVTTIGRPENIETLKNMLAPKNITWHVITDTDAPFELSFSEPWIYHYSVDNDQNQYFSRSNHCMNSFIASEVMQDDQMYCFLNDDDSYPEDFFTEIQQAMDMAAANNQSNDVIICSMERGHNVPPGLDPVRAHPTTKLWASPENMHPCHVGLEQLVIRGKILKNYQFGNLFDSDGRLIAEVVRDNPVYYVPDTVVYFNYYEPGRWNV